MPIRLDTLRQHMPPLHHQHSHPLRNIKLLLPIRLDTLRQHMQAHGHERSLHLAVVFPFVQHGNFGEWQVLVVSGEGEVLS